ncbi:ABC transporter substrate-binding protein [Kribbella sp. NPDC050124]|uniref:ABC transporter substrate-binding protein n=1 Tax=Kribbella sp. NPDC050124 TaxID=3364114 RepID=UPI0037A1871E
MATHISRRRLLQLGGLAAGSSLLTACGGGSNSAGGAVTVRVAYDGNAERTKQVGLALQKIQSKLTGVTIQSEFGGDDAFFTKVRTQIASGDGPDIFLANTIDLGNYVKSNAALDVGKYLPSVIKTADWDQQLLKAAQVDGKQYSIGTGVNSFCLLYDRPAFEKAGIKTLDPAWTWDDFAAIANEVSNANGRKPYGTSDAGRDLQAFQVFTRGNGGELFTPDGALGFTEEHVVAFWSLWKRLRDTGATVPAEVTAAADFNNNNLVKRKAAMNFDFSNRILSNQTLAGRPLGSTTYPQGDRPGTYIRPSRVWAVYSRSKNPEKAAQVLDGLLNDPDAALLIRTQLGVPNNPKNRAAVEASATADQAREFTHLELVEKHHTPLENVVFPAGGGDVSGAFQTYADKVAFGKLSVADAARALIADATKALKG